MGMAYVHVPIMERLKLYRVFEFGARIARQTYKPKCAKVGQKFRRLRHVTCFIFWYLCISVEWVKLETANIHCVPKKRPPFPIINRF